MILLADFQPLCIAKINMFHQQPRFYGQTRAYHSAKVNANNEVPCINYDLLTRCVTAPVSVDRNICRVISCYIFSNISKHFHSSACLS